MKREFLQLAQKYVPGKYFIGGWWWSEKLDGERCFWDGGITRGMPKSKVPWANTTKDARYITTQVATGLWSRYGHVIHAPSWWLDKLPHIPLDGELYGKMPRQEIHSAIKKIVPVDFDWVGIRLEVFDSPSYETVFATGCIDNVNFKKVFTNILEFICGCEAYRNLEYLSKSHSPYQSVYTRLVQLLGNLYPSCHLHPQYKLPDVQYQATIKLQNELDRISTLGGEGIIIRNPAASYQTIRTHSMLKVKTFDDDDGYVVDYITGKGKLLGMMGALVLQLANGQRLELSGFTESERELRPNAAKEWATRNPGVYLPACYEAVFFPRGTSVRFKYRGLNNSGIPNEARYWR